MYFVAYPLATCSGGKSIKHLGVYGLHCFNSTSLGEFHSFAWHRDDEPEPLIAQNVDM